MLGTNVGIYLPVFERVLFVGFKYLLKIEWLIGEVFGEKFVEITGVATLHCVGREQYGVNTMA